MYDKPPTCPICEEENVERDSLFPQLASAINCLRCGSFQISKQLSGWFETPQFQASPEKELLPYLSAHTKQESERKVIVDLNTSNWQEFARLHQSTAVSAKSRKLLELIAKRSNYPGDQIQLVGAYEYPLLDSKNEKEFDYLMNHLNEGGFVTWKDRTERKDDPLALYYAVLTTKGWQKLEPFGAGGIPGRCFVAMSFDPSLDDAYNFGICPALKQDCNLDPRRIDLVHHNEKICDKILSEIQLSSLLVTDFTLHRAGVYFEAGFAMGLGRPVIWTCHADEIDKAHFDTRQYNHIIWSDPADLRTKLTARIRALGFSKQ
jgi:hypothetical protein